MGVDDLKPYHFKKGKSGNPGGRPKDPITSALKQLTKQELKEIANLIIKGNLTKLKDLSKSEKASVIQVWLASVCVHAINKGDMDSLDKLLNRLIGKVQDEVHHTGDVIPINIKDLDEHIARQNSLAGIQESPISIESIGDDELIRTPDLMDTTSLDTDDTQG